MAKKTSARLSEFQYADAPAATPALAPKGSKRFDLARVDPAAKPFDLKRFDPAAKPFGSGDKLRDKEATAALATELDALQNLFYADRRFKLLVVLQGTDTSGKDGTIRGVFGQMSALGVHTVGWKAPPWLNAIVRSGLAR